MANKRALIVYGGWDGHTPKQSGEVFAPLLQAKGFEVEISDTLDVYADKAKMDSIDLVVPIWTMGQIKPEQEKGLLDAVQAGTGIAGFHGGMCDSFRNNTGFKITDKNHEITRGISDFELTNTERYWLHTDPGNKVLGTITFEDYNNLVMPYIWTRAWGQGKVFYAAWGHTYKDFDVPQAREIVLRGMLWASR
jgi:uncharacterized protein